MQVISITGYYGVNNARYNKNKTFQPSFGMARVDKSMSRFYEFNEKRFPTTVKDFLKTLTDKFVLTPLELQHKAYEKLDEAKNIEDVQKFFPNEELFIYLSSLKDTKACTGLLGLYREFKDLYENGILKDESDFTVYLLRKIFVETKTLDEINLDLENDLNPDIKSEYKRRNPGSPYLRSSTLKALGIYLPDVAYQNSLKFTREGYSDTFGLKISEAQYKYWNSLSEEQRFEILSKRCEGRDNWWNSLSYNEKLEYAAGINSDDDLYSNYKSFVRVQKRKSKTENVVGEAKLTKKRIAVGSANLKDKDIFVLWMKKNIERFYANLSERDKDTVHLKRVRRLTVRWQEMSPEERTELIQKMRIEREPIRFAMIDAWNHSHELIKELSAFLQSQQIFKPVDLLYSSEEFSEFQSRVMTEFWATHRALAEDFGEKIKAAQAKVEDALLHGQFEDVKQEILRSRAYRIKMLEHEKNIVERAKMQVEAGQAVLQKKTEAAEQISNLKEDFIKAFKERYDYKNVLPASYIKDMTDFFYEEMPEDILKEYTRSMIEKKPIPDNVQQYIIKAEHSEKSDYIKKINNALKFAIANELYSKGLSSKVYSYPVDTMIIFLQKSMTENAFKDNPVKPERVARLYAEFKKDLTDEESTLIGNNYFLFDKETYSNSEIVRAIDKYFSSYGRTLLMAFSEKSAYPDDVKIAFFQNFMDGIPDTIKEHMQPFWQTDKNIKNEREISMISNKLKQRLAFLPPEIGEIYSQEVATQVRMYANPYGVHKFLKMSKENYEKVAKSLSIENVKKEMCQKSTKTEVHSFNEIDKSTTFIDTKLRLLAIEQAMADELYRVSKNESMYELPFETLVNAFEILLVSSQKGKKILENGNEVYEFRETPRTQFLKMNYLKYYKELKEEVPEGIKQSNINLQEILYILNPYEDKPQRDEYIKNRINKYFDNV